MLKLVTWNTDDFNSFGEAYLNGGVNSLCEVNVHDDDMLLALFQDLDDVVNTFRNACNMFNQENQALGVAEYTMTTCGLCYLYSYDDCNWKAMPVKAPDTFKQVNVSELNRLIGQIENWCDEAYTVDDEIGIAIESIKKLLV